MRILIILTLTVAAFAYGWMHQEINVSPNYSSTKHRPAFSTEGTELPDGQKLSSAKLNFVCDRRSDSLEFVKFYNATGGPNWWKKWDLNKSMDTWWGIRLTSEGCILTIFLKDTIIGSCCSGNNLIGQVPTLNLPELNDLILGYSSNLGNFPNLESLPKLRNLFFYTTNFNGILIDFTNLSNLISCHIQNCGISGVIPNFSNLPKLEFLNLIDNKLIGEIPNFKNSPNLKELHLYDNLLSGNIPNFSNLPKLQQLSLGSNQISGNIPDFNKIPNLEFLHLWENNLSGNIPNFKYLPELRYLYLNENKLSGTIPNFEFCKKLSEIGIYENNIEGNLPNHINTNPLLTEYKLYGNKLTFSSFIQNLSQVIKLVNINNKTCQTCTFDTLIYAPQQKIYYDTSILISSNSTYTLDLLIDDTVTTSTYAWYKNGILYKTIKGSNKLPFTPFTSADAGTYTGKITNPLAPQLTLESWPIRLNAGPSLVCDRRSDSLELVKFYNATGGQTGPSNGI
ncbi:MAG: leucine-rich repeat domain-containing protein [Saprospiraceae bacterium]|nr:leucine-rich repeat domain-containing protein [Saprospiraceae bacterium]